MKALHSRLLALGTCLCAAAAQAAPVTLEFRVRAEPGGADARCEAAAADRCRDDLGLPEVFDALRRMAAGRAPSPFAAHARGEPVAGVDVLLGAGTFRVQAPLRLADWGGAPGLGALRVAGAGASKTIVSGAVTVPASAWQPVPDDEPRLAAQARAQVRMAPLAGWLPRPAATPQRRVSGFGEPVVPVALELFADGRPLPLARWPNGGWALVDAPAGAPAGAPQRVPVKGGHPAAWRREPALMAAGYFSHDWAFERIPVQDIAAGDGALQLQGAGARFGVRGGQRLVVENALSELDSPGEWYVDTAQQRLYLWPAAAGTEIEVSVASSLLLIEQSRGVTVQGMTFQGATGDAVRVEQSRNVTLVDSVVRNAGNRAVIVDGGHSVLLRGLLLTDLGEGGIVVSGGDRRSLARADHVVEACRIERFARLSRSYRPAISVEGVGISLLRNRIADGPHSAIVFNGNDHRIEGNHISDVVTETNDAGAIYTGRDWTTRGTVIRNNLLQNIYPRLSGAVSVMGVYLDDQASGATISGNIFANVSRAVFIGGGRDNIVEHNLFVASSPAIFADNRGLTWQREQTQDTDGHLRRNLRNIPVTGEVYRSRYAHLADILDDEPGRSKYNRAAGNLFVASRETEFLDGAQTGIQLSGNRSIGWDAFKTLRATKPQYAPHDFDLAPAVLSPQDAAAFPSRDGIPR